MEEDPVRFDVSGRLLAQERQGDNAAALSITELSMLLKRTVEDRFGHVRLRGEISGFKRAASGHVYLALKDDNAVIDGVMWKGTAARLAFRPEDGLEVIATGKITTYPGRSKYQIVIEGLELAGEGALMQLFEKLKARLSAEGLFDPAKRRPIPMLPRVIGVVTSPTGAVIRDILHRLADRFPSHVLLWPVLVQGDGAAAQVAAAVRGFGALPAGGAVPRPDVLIVARGGGSIEDLWAFNEEIVVRAAAASAIPLISAVGHETDTTLIDFASDKRAPTPTAAAEMAVPVRADLIQRATTLEGRLKNGLVRGLDKRRTELRAANGRLPRLETLFQIPQQRFDRASERLAASLVANTRAAQSKLDRIAARLRAEALAQDVMRRREKLAQSAARIGPAMARNLLNHRKHLDASGRMLESLSHKSVLARGFVMVHREDGVLVRSAKELNAGDVIELTFADDHRQAVIDPARAPTAEPAKPRPKAKPGADQGDLF